MFEPGTERPLARRRGDRGIARATASGTLARMSPTPQAAKSAMFGTTSAIAAGKSARSASKVSASVRGASVWTTADTARPVSAATQRSRTRRTRSAGRERLPRVPPGAVHVGA